MARKKEDKLQVANGRNRLIATATALFTTRGASNVGINDVTDAAKVAKMTLYNNFPSKEALVLAVYGELQEVIFRNLRSIDMQGKSEEERLIALIDRIDKDMSSDDSRGCPFIHATFQTAESKGPVHTLVQSYKRGLRDYVFGILDKDRANRAELADQLLILLDGLTTESYIRGVAKPGDSTKRAAVTLLRFSS